MRGDDIASPLSDGDDVEDSELLLLS